LLGWGIPQSTIVANTVFWARSLALTLRNLKRKEKRKTCDSNK